MNGTMRSLSLGSLMLTLVACQCDPSSYNDCILKAVKAGMSDSAVRLVKVACRQKFPEEPTPRVPATPLPDEAKAKLKGRLGPSLGSLWRGNLYNGNTEWTVQEVELIVNDPIDEAFSLLKENRTDDIMSSRYRVSVEVPPLTNVDFTVSVNWPQDRPFQWRLDSAKGHK